MAACTRRQPSASRTTPVMSTTMLGRSTVFSPLEQVDGHDAVEAESREATRLCRQRPGGEEQQHAGVSGRISFTPPTVSNAAAGESDMTPGSAVASAPTISAWNSVPAQRHSSRSASPDGRARAVRARAGHRVVGVGDVHDARGKRDVVAAQAVRVAAAVRPLVVELDDRQVRREKRHRPQDARAEHRDAA